MILPTGKKRRSNSGFTLIELVLVIFLISILVALSTPLFKRTFTNLELKNVSFNIAKIISYAREMAIVERANYRINFDFGRFFYLPEGVTLEAEAEEINLYPDGSCDRVEIRIADEKGRGYLLRVREFGSHVKIEEINGG